MNTRVFRLSDSQLFKRQALQWASTQDPCCYLDSHGYSDPYGQMDVWIGVGQMALWSSREGQNNWLALQAFLDAYPQAYMPGYLSYDLKNEIEALTTREPNRTGFADAQFFVPLSIIEIHADSAKITADDPVKLFDTITQVVLKDEKVAFEGKLQQRMNRAQYLEAFARIQQHILRGDCYEINLCQEFYAEQASLNPIAAYQQLKQISPTPFSAFMRFGEQYIICASPERFLTKKGQQLRSQPIKGTAPRKDDPEADRAAIQALRQNPKERSENIMIVDLVRNDLTKAALPGTVKAIEITEVYSFKQVHQLISTIEAEADPKQNQTTLIQHCFPPGSMTGAPKISAMQRIDEVENSRRGVYSGALGYFAPFGDFDFNVVIRSLLYNQATGYLSFHTGGAITAQSQGESEFEECLLKGKALFQLLGKSLS
jgi:para-aminobenzoate synthetase component 1